MDNRLELQEAGWKSETASAILESWAPKLCSCYCFLPSQIYTRKISKLDHPSNFLRNWCNSSCEGFFKIFLLLGFCFFQGWGLTLSQRLLLRYLIQFMIFSFVGCLDCHIAYVAMFRATLCGDSIFQVTPQSIHFLWLPSLHFSGWFATVNVNCLWVNVNCSFWRALKGNVKLF